ncbi:glycoside hydrolase family 15 protein [Amycolatopsis endophytica]|uniref:GH15 family glucan-1,4-alpha-glucosidase n=1 Tax=Amycolatopsis endophytica TaxID=860233 RepID=A0A853B9Q7_9PSEU|nr:glycoside hydrolase family 15 protein [Amycolatopsis endophytica]NYI91504.1 GH15 family glucan-1,4-alpha-glucosidase [Amycolatopsis endophytica]
MALRIEDYALIGDTRTAGLVGRDGSIDWLCLPRIDSGACFAALLGGAEHGRWALAPAGAARTVRRAYRHDTLMLETELANDEGTVRITDFMPVRPEHPRVLRLVEGVRGRVRMRSEVTVRFDYGHDHPWIRGDDDRLRAISGPHAVILDGDVPHRHDDRAVCSAEFSVGEGERAGLRLSWTGARQSAPEPVDVVTALRDTDRWWRDWAARCTYRGAYRDAVVRSLITVKALTYAPSGGIAAAATTSLPERLGGVRNWDYRFCWIRDATFTLMTLLEAGYEREARDWREWLLRATAGAPEQMQIMYGIDGERRLTESELPWLPGYAGSRPVRTGNAASAQFQLDTYGELMDALHQARARGIPPDRDAWRLQRSLLDFLESHWDDPDNGIWEMRGPRRHFTHSRVMAWAAVDRAVRGVEQFGLDGPLDRWKALREEIFTDVCRHGFDADQGTFTQYYGGSTVDAALLLLPAVGFLPADDRRTRGTVAAIEKHLLRDGLVQRYPMTDRSQELDGLPAGEGVFLPCSFWLADNYILQGRRGEGRALFERLLDLRSDVGLLSEEYDTGARRLVGNVPQALSHVALISTALNLDRNTGPVHRRSG